LTESKLIIDLLIERLEIKYIFTNLRDNPRFIHGPLMSCTDRQSVDKGMLSRLEYRFSFFHECLATLLVVVAFITGVDKPVAHFKIPRTEIF